MGQLVREPFRRVFHEAFPVRILNLELLHLFDEICNLSIYNAIEYSSSPARMLLKLAANLSRRNVI
jgi:hypothetical protein